jgi:hypothetical protein
MLYYASCINLWPSTIKERKIVHLKWASVIIWSTYIYLLIGYMIEIYNARKVLQALFS